MKPRTLLVLTLVVAALAAFVWFYERKLPTSDEAKAEEKKVLAGTKADAVREVSIVRGATTVHIVREGKPPAEEEKKASADEESPMMASTSEWRLTSPLQARADRSAVDALLSSVLGLEKARTLEKVDRKEYGLAPPAATVTVVTADGKRTLEVGRELPGTDQRAVAVAGEPEVHAVSGSFWSDLVKPPGDWRSRELFAGSRDDVERVSLQTGANRIVLARRGDEPWVEAPIADRADRERFDALVDALTGLQATEFVDQPPAPAAALGLEPPQTVVEVARKGQAQPFRLLLGAPKAEPAAAPTPAPTPTPTDSSGGGETKTSTRYARADGQLVTLSSPALEEAVARPAQEWRSRAWSAFAVYEVDKVEVKDGHGALILTRDEGDWKRAPGDKPGAAVKIFYGTVSDFLAAVTDAKADKLLDAATSAGLAGGPPAMTLTLTGSGGKTQTLTLWPGRVEGPAGPGAPAKSSGRDAVLLMPAGLPADLAEKLAAVRKAEPLKETPTPSPAS
ncbi:MAG TPA: DUF4340 domain-containing protein [Thermoanaerobaculia bacterium]|jgi:hypothetical protein|nr:DUF4340 domain-containing protein [Thermoanaerobaculia bacterium]